MGLMPQRTASRVELGRLAKFAAQLYLSCRHAARKPRKPDEADIVPLLDKVNAITARRLGQVVLKGQLIAAAEFFVEPWTRCPCGLRFVAQVEPYLSTADVQRLHELWDTQVDVEAEIAAFLAQSE